jgi:diguanylate cyclase (GGDEF)-like protein/PAS domain S-box-containing protein
MVSRTRALANDDLAQTLGPSKSEGERFRTLADHVPTMLWMTDSRGRMVYFNRRWLDFTGLTLETALGNAWVNSLLDSDRERCQQTFSNALERRGQMEMEYALRRHDGQYRNMLSLGEPVHNEDGLFTGYVGCVVDITTQTRNKEELHANHLALRKRSREIELLNQLTDNLQVCRNVDETKPILKRYGQQLFPAFSISICLFNESRNLVEPFVSWGTGAAIEHTFAPHDCWALRKSKAHVELNEGAETVCPNFAGCGGKQYLCVPLMGYGEVIGNLYLEFSADAVSMAPDDLEEGTNEQIALALANLKLRATLQYQSTRDPLTKLYNRRYLIEALEREISRSTRTKKSLAIVIIDVDHFKRQNDTYGHAAGDHLLIEVGALLRQIIRESDIACRYGGEEFVLLLPESSGEDACRRADELRKQIAALRVEHHGQQLGQITISVGVAGSSPDEGATAEALIGAADSALYQAKSRGRNCVVMSQRET